MKLKLDSFVAGEDGAVTVDWVLLTGLIVGLQVLLLLTPLREALLGTSEAIGDKAAEYEAFLER
jgi:hypothetical protein